VSNHYGHFVDGRRRPQFADSGSIPDLAQILKSKHYGSEHIAAWVDIASPNWVVRKCTAGFAALGGVLVPGVGLLDWMECTGNVRAWACAKLGIGGAASAQQERLPISDHMKVLLHPPLLKPYVLHAIAIVDARAEGTDMTSVVMIKFEEIVWCREDSGHRSATGHQIPAGGCENDDGSDEHAGDTSPHADGGNVSAWFDPENDYRMTRCTSQFRTLCRLDGLMPNFLDLVVNRSQFEAVCQRHTFDMLENEEPAIDLIFGKIRLQSESLKGAGLELRAVCHLHFECADDGSDNGSEMPVIVCASLSNSEVRHRQRRHRARGQTMRQATGSDFYSRG
jgi:hypothetical protein